MCNAENHLRGLVTLDATWWFILQRNCTIAHSAASHSIRLEIWKGTCSLVNCPTRWSLSYFSSQITKKYSIVLCYLLTHSEEKPHKCVHCNCSFTQAGGLKRHRMIHAGEKPHQCSQCRYSSITFKDKRLHEMTHSGETPHKCSQCDYSSTTSGQLTIHMRSAHTGEKPYKCDQCGSSFVSASNLQSHNKSHTGKG